MTVIVGYSRTFGGGGATPFTTEWKSAGAGASEGGGNEPWSDPGNITASDDNRATATTATPDDISDILRATSFGFTTSDVPAGATILGIEVGIERQSSMSNTVDSVVRLRTSSGQTGDDKADTGTTWPAGSDAEAIYGGAADTWAAGLSDSDIRSSGFGVDLQVDIQPQFTTTVSVDHIRIRVHGEG